MNENVFLLTYIQVMCLQCDRFTAFLILSLPLVRKIYTLYLRQHSYDPCVAGLIDDFSFTL